MDSPHLSAEINQKIAESNRNNGFFVDQVAPDTLFELHVLDSHVYWVLVIDPEKGLVVVCGTSGEFSKPALCSFHGSTFGGSMLKMKWVGIGMYFEARRIGGETFVLPSLERFVMLTDAPLAEQLREAVKSDLAALE